MERFLLGVHYPPSLVVFSFLFSGLKRQVQVRVGKKHWEMLQRLHSVLLDLNPEMELFDEFIREKQERKLPNKRNDFSLVPRELQVRYRVRGFVVECR